MNALTAVQNNAVDSGQDYSGFTLTPSAQSPRLLELTFTEQTTKQFLEQVAEWPVQALEYKSFLRFRVAKILDDLCANQLQPLLLKTLLNRAEGALLINAVGVDDVKQADEMVKLATAVAHLIGRSNFDAMSGQYYARFVVKNVDNSDSYLRQPHRVMELHNDGTYVEEITDYVLMMKIDEQNMQGGNSLLLHLDDWEHLDNYFRHPLARRPMRFAAPPSKNVSKDVFHPVFDVDQQGRPVMRYIDQFVQPKDFEEGVWLCELSDAIETSKGILSVPVPVGKFLLINNLFWLHGRDRFTPHPDLQGSAGTMTLWMVIVVVLSFGVCSLGVQRGLEKITKVMMLCLLALIVVLAVHSITLDGAMEGVKFYLVPDFSAMKELGIGNVIFGALSQAFFTLSIGAGSMTIFGSYLGKDRSHGTRARGIK